MPEGNGLTAAGTDGSGFGKEDFPGDPVDAHVIETAHHGTEYKKKPGQWALQVRGHFEE
jgi:hypothetical protein